MVSEHLSIECEVEGRPLVDCCVYPNPPTVARDDALYRRQTNASAGKFLGADATGATQPVCAGGVPAGQAGMVGAQLNGGDFE